MGIANATSVHPIEVVEDGITYVYYGPAEKHRYAKCCGRAHCTSKCHAIIFHGPGHQSKTHCEMEGDHKVHRALYGSLRQQATWIGDEAFTGAFDDPSTADWNEDTECQGHESTDGPIGNVIYCDGSCR